MIAAPCFQCTRPAMIDKCLASCSATCTPEALSCGILLWICQRKFKISIVRKCYLIIRLKLPGGGGNNLNNCNDNYSECFVMTQFWPRVGTGPGIQSIKWMTVRRASMCIACQLNPFAGMMGRHLTDPILIWTLNVSPDLGSGSQWWRLGSLLLSRFNFNPSMDK